MSSDTQMVYKYYPELKREREEPFWEKFPFFLLLKLKESYLLSTVPNSQRVVVQGKQGDLGRGD